MEKNNQPQVRFNGFSDKWKEIKLSEIADIIGGGTPSTSVSEYWNGKIDWYSPTEIGEKVFANGSVKKITEFGLEKCSAKILPANRTILFTSRAGIGDMAILAKEGATNQGFQSLVLKKGFHTYFIYSANELIKKYALSKASGSTFLEISSKVLGNMDLLVPEYIEQEKIGEFFENIDSLITEHQQKHVKLKSLKQAMLSKMFPKQGQLVPEIRFKGFEGDWEEKKLSELSNYSNGKGYESFQSKTGKYELINLNSISIDGGLKPSGKFISHADTTLKENDLVMILSDVGHGDLLGRVALIPADDKYVLNQRVALLRPNKDISPYFLYYNINANQLYFKTQGAGMSQLNLSKKSVEDFTSLIPKEIDEQIEIADYFINIDHLIVNHGTQISKLQIIKKAFLAKMFI